MVGRNTATDGSKKLNINRLICLCMMGTGFLAIFLMTAYTFWVQYRNFKNESELFRERTLHEQKRVLKQKVNDAIAFARYKRKSRTSRLRADIKSRVHEACAIAQNLYDQYENRLPPAAIARLIKTVLRPVRFNDGRGYYFIVSLDGVEELYPTRPEMEGKNLMDLRDIKGKYVIQDEIQTVEQKGEGFVTGYWPNPVKENDKGSLQHCFIKKFPPLDWLIGTGEFIDNVEAVIKQETLQWLTRIRYGNDNYIFVDTYDGDALIMNGQLVKSPKNIWDLKDANGTRVIQAETRIALENPQGGYLSYSWPRIGETRPVRVLSFVKALPEWEWVIGSSLYLDDIEAAIREQQKRLKSHLLLDAKLILAGFLCGLPLILGLSLLVARLFTRQCEVFISFFKNLDPNASCGSADANGPPEIDPSRLNIQEFVFLAHAANQMLCKQREAEEKLERLSRTDPLTRLPNRRDMQERIAQEAGRAVRYDRPLTFVLMDIDHFKRINDQYGHDAGDIVLQRTAEILRNSLRQSDAVCRWGGEEFLAMLPETGLEAAIQVAEKLRGQVKAARFRFADQDIQITLTCGVREFYGQSAPEKAITQADALLLDGKRQGRDRVVSQPLTP